MAPKKSKRNSQIKRTVKATGNNKILPLVHLGRNDPCYCGSTKKYKNCCMENPKPNAGDLIDYFNHWQKTQKAHRVLEAYIKDLDETTKKTMLSFYTNNPLIEEEDWLADNNPEWNDLHNAQSMNTMKLMLYSILNKNEKDQQTILNYFVHFCEEEGLDDFQIDYLLKIAKTEGSFYRILKTSQENNTTNLEDIYTGETFIIVDRGLSRQTVPCALIYGRPLLYDAQKEFHVLEAPMPILIEPGRESYVSGELDFLKNIHKKDLSAKAKPKEILNKITSSPVWITTAYAWHKAHPKMVNRDGDEICHITAFYTFNDRNAVVDFFANHPETEVDEHKNSEAEIVWLDKSNTVLVSGTLKEGTLEVYTNSLPRFQKFEKIIKKSKLLKLRDLEQKSTAQLRNEKEGTPAAEPQIDLEANPEIKEQVREFIIKQMSGWPFENIPALGNQRPADLVKTPEGRTQVIALIDKMEHDYASKAPEDPLHGLKLDFIREQLEL